MIVSIDNTTKTGVNVLNSELTVSTVNLHSDVNVYDTTLDCFNC